MVCASQYKTDFHQNCNIRTQELESFLKLRCRKARIHDTSRIISNGGDYAIIETIARKELESVRIQNPLPQSLFSSTEQDVGGSSSRESEIL
jgi:hypothetical protein